MDRIMLLCCRSCLRGDGDNTEYYEILGIETSANQDAIKKAYKKTSLNLHPDKLAQRGIEVTADHKLQFQKCKDAYDVLSNPKRKSMYDSIGANGLKLVETPSQVNPADLIKNFQKNRSDRFAIALFVALIFCCLLIGPILFSLKCDNILGRREPWVAIWTPFWLADAILLILAFLLFLDTQDKVNEDGEAIEQEKIPIFSKLFNLSSIVLFILLQIFLFMQLDKYTNNDWFEVFSPWLVYEGIHFLRTLPTALSIIPFPNIDVSDLPNEDEENGENSLLMKKITLDNEYFEALLRRSIERKNAIGYALRAWLAVFLALKLNGTVNWNWALVLLPVWTYLFAQYTFAYSYRIWGEDVLKKIGLKDLEEGIELDPETAAKIQQGQQLISTAFISMFFTLTPTFIFVLLVSRLEAAKITTFVIILPVFITLCCCCCVVFCGIICLSSVDTDELSREEIFKAPEPEDEFSGEGTGPYEPPAPIGVQIEVNTEGEGGEGSYSGLAYGTFNTPPNGSIETNRDQFYITIHGVAGSSVVPPLPPVRDQSERFDID